MTAAAELVKIDGYHAHVYYDAETRPRASQLRGTIAATLGVEVRELSDAPRGPHPVPQFRFSFTTAQFEKVVPWLMLNRQGLDVLVHPPRTTPTTTTLVMPFGSATLSR